MSSTLFHARRGVLAAACAASLLLLPLARKAEAAVVPTVTLGTADDYSVLGGATVTNAGASVLNQSLGLSPGTSITGFPPGQVVAPGTIDNANAAAAQAQSDLTNAYIDAAGRPLDATTTADLGGLVLQGGVYAGPGKGALGLTGTLTLDGAGNADSVFIFQTDSSLITATSSTVVLINGAQACNVFWQVGSSATLGTGSNFVGNILALTSITVDNSVVVSGRVLARNGAVTLDNDVFQLPGCASGPTPTTSTTTSTTTTPSTSAAPTTTAAGPARSITTVSRGVTTTSELPLTGRSVGPIVAVGVALIALGSSAIRRARLTS